MTYAKIVADSISEHGVRLTTMEVRFHRFVLAEFNTHRVFSRNSASSRAIPVAKQIKRLEEHPAVPLTWPAEKKGMQGGDALWGNDLLDADQVWREARSDAIMHAEYLHNLGVHKSVTNRLLEPFMWHTVVVTSTAWDNFFAQRVSPLAQPEIRKAAEMMLKEYEKSKPLVLHEGQWHLPYITIHDEEIFDWLGTHSTVDPRLAPISAARCARVSYLTQDGKRDFREDLRLYERLTSANPPHWSPLEHVATPWDENVQMHSISFKDRHGQQQVPEAWHLPRYGNLLGWRSLRTEVESSTNTHTFS